MNLKPFGRFQDEIPALLQSLQERLKDKNNLVYYASGTTIRQGYSALPYDNIVLVDKAFRRLYSIKGNVITIGLTALEATAIFREAGVNFDAFVCINEGLWEGGGTYPINGNWSLGSILPILKEKYLHIACPEYYGKRKWKKMFNLPHQAKLLKSYDEGYVDPTTFSDYNRIDKDFSVWQVIKQPGEAATFKVGNRKITVQRKNIWDNYDEQDAIFIRCSPNEAHNIKKLFPKAVPFNKDYSTEQILRLCNLHKIEKLGLSPWRSGQYNSFINFLKENEDKYPYPKELSFYHLHHNDFEQLYIMAGVEVPVVNEQDIKQDDLPELPPMLSEISFSENDKLKILYLHGFDSSLSDTKRVILEQYGEVAAPAIEYREPNYLKKLIDLAEISDVIIGSSFGGHTGYIQSLLFDKPSLLFNPAFVTSIPNPDKKGLTIPETKKSYTKIVLGKDDDIIIFEDNKKHINQTLEAKNLSIVEVDGLGHRVPEHVFAEQVAEFMTVLQRSLA